MLNRQLLTTMTLGLLVLGVPAQSQQSSPTPATITSPAPKPDVIFVPTPQRVVEAMLRGANVRAGDIVYDLGSGDGRIPITAVQKFGATKAVGVEIDPKLVVQSRANAQTANVSDRVQFLQQDLFKTDFSEATVVTLYLLPELNLRLRPTILRMRPGTRVVSHSFDMGNWKPDRTEVIDGRTIHFWTVPREIPAGLR